jgi:hypothetical protein
MNEVEEGEKGEGSIDSRKEGFAPTHLSLQVAN